MQNVLKIMDDEHTQIEALYHTFLHSLKDEQEQSVNQSDLFRLTLKIHFK